MQILAELDVCILQPGVTGAGERPAQRRRLTGAPQLRHQRGREVHLRFWDRWPEGGQSIIASEFFEPAV
jgi:hypothetical protein